VAARIADELLRFDRGALRHRQALGELLQSILLDEVDGDGFLAAIGLNQCVLVGHGFIL